MSVKMLSLVLEHGPTDALEKLVMVVIADHADDGGQAFPGIPLIARKSCQSERNAMRVLDRLEISGWMTVKRKAYRGKGNIYQLNVSRLRTGVVIGDTVSRDTVSPKRPMKTENKDAYSNSHDTVSPIEENPRSGDTVGKSQVTKSTFSGDKSSGPFNVFNRQEPPIEPKATTTPLPPSKSRGERVEKVHSAAVESTGSRTCDDAVRKVMRELNISERRMEPVIARAIKLHRAKTDDPPDCNAVAEGIVAARGEYLGYSAVLKFPVNVRKFIERGIWCDRRQWVFDEKRVQEMQRANVGSSRRE